MPPFNPEVYPPVPDSQPGTMMSLLLEVTANALANSVPPPTPLEELPAMELPLPELPPIEFKPGPEESNYEQMFYQMELRDRTEKYVVNQEMEDWVRGVDPSWADKLLYGNFDQEYHGMTAAEYVEQHRDENGRFDPSQLITAPSAKVRLQLENEQDFPEINMMEMAHQVTTGKGSSLLPPKKRPEMLVPQQSKTPQNSYPFPTWGGKGPLSRRKHQSDPPQKSISLKSWFQQHKKDKHTKTQEKAQSDDFLEVDILSTIEDEPARELEKALTEEPSMRQMASDLEQLKAQMKVMVQLMATLAEPTSHENKKILQQKNDNQSQAQRRKFDPLPVSPSQLLPGLVAAGLLTPIPLRVTAGSLSKGFDPEVRCDLNMGSPGHDTNKCHSLRHAIQNLIDKHLLHFQRSEVAK